MRTPDKTNYGLRFTLIIAWLTCLWGVVTTQGWVQVGFLIAFGMGVVYAGMRLAHIKWPAILTPGSRPLDLHPEASPEPYIERKSTGPGKTGAQILTFRYPKDKELSDE